MTTPKEGDAVERVARIMVRELYNGATFDDCTDAEKSSWRQAARAVIATGLVPDEAAVRALAFEEAAKIAEATEVRSNGHPQIDAPTPGDMRRAIAAAIRSGGGE